VGEAVKSIGLDSLRKIYAFRIAPMSISRIYAGLAFSYAALRIFCAVRVLVYFFGKMITARE
jgi:hypothetical protein